MTVLSLLYLAESLAPEQGIYSCTHVPLALFRLLNLSAPNVIIA